MVPTICAWYLPTNQPMLPTTCVWYLPTYLPTNGTYHLCLVPSYLPTYQWYLPPVLGTLLPSYLPNVPTTCAWYLPTNHLLGYVADTERGREREGWSSFVHKKKLSWLLLAILCTQLQPSAQVLLQQQELVCECMYVVAILLLLLPFVVVVLCTASHNHFLFFCLFSLRSSTNAAIAFIVCSILHQLRSW